MVIQRKGFLWLINSVWAKILLFASFFSQAFLFLKSIQKVSQRPFLVIVFYGPFLKHLAQLHYLLVTFRSLLIHLIVCLFKTLKPQCYFFVSMFNFWVPIIELIVLKLHLLTRFSQLVVLFDFLSELFYFTFLSLSKRPVLNAFFLKCNLIFVKVYGIAFIPGYHLPKFVSWIVIQKKQWRKRFVYELSLKVVTIKLFWHKFTSQFFYDTILSLHVFLFVVSYWSLLQVMWS